MLRILSPGTYTSLQSLNILHDKFRGHPDQGPLDSLTAKTLLATMDCKSDHSFIECISVGPKIIFDSLGYAIIGGANMIWKLDDIPIDLNKPFRFKKNQVLTSGRAKDCEVSYLIIKGGLSYPHQKSKRINHRLIKDDVLHFPLINDGLVKLNMECNFSFRSNKAIPFKEGPEWQLLTEDQKDFIKQTTFSKTMNGSRKGWRLSPNIEGQLPALKFSVATVPGMIQCTENGHLIALLNDGPVTGGYPRIMYLNEYARSKFAQTPIGESFQFSHW